MAEIVLVAESGRQAGSRPARRLRASGRVPGVVYGRGTKPIPVSVVGRDLRTALTTEAGLNALLSLQVDGTSHLTLAREIQRHPVRGTVLHVDFQVVDREQKVSAEVPVNLIGEATEVAHADGVVEQQLFSLAVKARPEDIPPHLEADISGLTVGGAVRVSDVSLPAGVETDLDPDTVVVTGVPPRVQTRAEELAEGEVAQAEEGAEAAAQAGAGEAAATEGEAPAPES
ncbi:MAG TPA: 50S ribosomal protein L25 [Acidimicrobiales bacterium]|nr:50S ribosomal protein L25 [Acidimicrobiales bacterium]